jgi:protein SCO1/2
VASGYRLGASIVVIAILFSGALCLAWVRASSRTAGAPAGQDLGDGGEPVGTFSMVERSGSPVTDATLRDRVWVASFIFTRCKLSCPRITSVMKSLQDRLGDADVQLVSISVDPEHDTPEVMREYAQTFGADPDRWWFLTGPKDETLEFIRKNFLVTAMTNPSPAADGSDEDVIHSDRLALVDRGRLVGLFESNDPEALNALVLRAKRLVLPSWVRTLPPINATLNGLCTVLLLIGWRAIRRPSSPATFVAIEGEAQSKPTVAGRFAALWSSPAARGHVMAMGMAVLTSAIFLGSYLVYHAFAGSKRFPGEGFSKWAYLTILTSHSLLAALAAAPLVAVILYRALRGDFAGHARVSRVAFPIWLYVSITGVVIYWMLYQTPVGSPG